MEIIADLFDSFLMRSGYLFKRLDFTFVIVDNAVRRLHIRFIITFGADDERVLADIRNEHKFVRHAAAHHIGVALYRNKILYAATTENAIICLITFIVITEEVVPGGMEGVCVLHGKLSDADKSAAGARLVTEFCLYLINHIRKLSVCLRRYARKMNGSFLVRHSEYHIGAVSVLEAKQLATDGIISAGFPPYRRRHCDGEKHFLTADSVHFLAQNVFNLSRYTLCGRIERKNARSDLLYISSSDHQRVARNLTIRRSFLEMFAQEL